MVNQDKAQKTYTARSYKDESDLQPIVDLVNLCSDYSNLGDSQSLSDMQRSIEEPGVDPQRDIRLWFGEDGKLAAFGGVSEIAENNEGKLSARLFLRIHPDDRAQPLEDEAVNWGVQRMAEATREKRIPGNLHMGTRENDNYSRELLSRHGFAPERYFFRMERHLNEPIPEPVLPEGYKFSYVQTDEDLHEWVRCFSESFIDHWDFTPITFEQAKHFNASTPSYRPENDLVIVAPDGTFAAFAFCDVDPEENARNNRNIGWIHLVGTRRGHRKIGLGKAVLVAGLQRLKELGVEEAWLGVDADNPTGALGLYENAGFHKLNTSTVMTKLFAAEQ